MERRGAEDSDAYLTSAGAYSGALLGVMVKTRLGVLDSELEEGIWQGSGCICAGGCYTLSGGLYI